MKNEGINISKDLLFQADIQNTIGGGVCMPTVRMKKAKGHAEIRVRVPGVSAEDLRVEIINNQLHILHLVPVSQDLTEEKGAGAAPRVIKTLFLPQTVNRARVRAEHDNGELLVTLPYTEWTSGDYRRSIRIEL